MNQGFVKMAGVFFLILSVYLLFFGLYLTDGLADGTIRTVLVVLGLVFLAAGIVFYSILKPGEK